MWLYPKSDCKKRRLYPICKNKPRPNQKYSNYCVPITNYLLASTSPNHFIIHYLPSTTYHLLTTIYYLLRYHSHHHRHNYRHHHQQHYHYVGIMNCDLFNTHIGELFGDCNVDNNFWGRVHLSFDRTIRSKITEAFKAKAA